MSRVTDIVNRAMNRVRWEWATRSLRNPTRPDDCGIHRKMGAAAAILGSGATAFILGKASTALAADDSQAPMHENVLSYAVPFAMVTSIPGVGVFLHHRWYKRCMDRYLGEPPSVFVPRQHAQTVKAHPVIQRHNETWVVPHPNAHVVAPIATVGVLTYLGYFLLSAADAGATVLGGFFAPSLRYMPNPEDERGHSIL